MSVLTQKMETLKNGSGNSDQSVSETLTRSIAEMVRTKRKNKSMPYKMVGPRYIRTLETSSEMRDMRSPVEFRL